jgi:MtN3 and saliva related transmembrane protein
VNTIISTLGYLAAFLTTFSFLPQVIKVLKNKQTKDLSLIMYSMFSFGVFCWLMYGLLKPDAPIAIANAITFLFAAMVLVLKIKNG